MHIGMIRPQPQYFINLYGNKRIKIVKKPCDITRWEIFDTCSRVIKILTHDLLQLVSGFSMQYQSCKSLVREFENEEAKYRKSSISPFFINKKIEYHPCKSNDK